MTKGRAKRANNELMTISGPCSQDFSCWAVQSRLFPEETSQRENGRLTADERNAGSDQNESENGDEAKEFDCNSVTVSVLCIIGRFFLATHGTTLDRLMKKHGNDLSKYSTKLASSFQVFFVQDVEFVDCGASQ